ncbi:MAG: hypothetical protein V3V49_07655, partial [Candidatus Krumholzibacteria bacterium]
VAGIRSTVTKFLGEGGEKLLQTLIRESLKPNRDIEHERRHCKERISEINGRIDELLDCLTVTNKEFVDQKLAKLKEERDGWVLREEDIRKQAVRAHGTDAFVRDAIECIRGFDEVFAEGTREERKELVSLFVEKIEVNPKERIARVRIRKFPAPNSLDTGNLLVLVAGAGFEPATFGLCVPLQLSLPTIGLWSGLSLHPQRFFQRLLGRLPSSLYTFSEILRAWLGITSPTASPNLTGVRTRVSPCTAHCWIRFHASRYAAERGFR